MAHSVIEAKDILEWCFVVGALDFGVFGFLYATYAAASFAGPTRPPIVKFLRLFCWVVCVVLAVLAGLAAYTGWQAHVDASVWTLIGCLAVSTVFSVALALKME